MKGYVGDFIFANNRQSTGVAKFDEALLGVDNKRLTYSKLIGKVTMKQIDRKINSVGGQYLKNPPAHPDSWLDDIDIDNVPIA